METTDDTDAPPPTPPPQEPPPPPPPPHDVGGRRLTRSASDKVVAGVCGGLGHYFGIDPVIFRIAFVVLALAGGTGLFLYVLGWLLVPEEGATPPGAGYDRLAGSNPSRVAAAVLGGVAVILLLDAIVRDGDDGLPVGLVLLGLGAALLWSRGQGPKGEPPTLPGGGDPPPEPAALGSTEASTPRDPATHTAPPAPAVPVTLPGARLSRPPSALVPVTLSLLAVLAGGLALLDVTDVMDVSIVAGLSLALVLTGGALVVGAWRGRGRWLIPVGLLLTMGLAVATVIDVPLGGGAGERLYRPLSERELDSPYRLTAGDLTVDLSDLTATETTRSVVASVAMGELTVIVPGDANVRVSAHAGVGEVIVLGEHSGGIEVDRSASIRGNEGGGELVVRARVGLGRVEVLRARA